ncbi:hypothetical protein D3C86_1174860 [compost metagenome]
MIGVRHEHPPLPIEADRVGVGQEGLAPRHARRIVDVRVAGRGAAGGLTVLKGARRPEDVTERDAAGSKGRGHLPGGQVQLADAVVQRVRDVKVVAMLGDADRHGEVNLVARLGVVPVEVHGRDPRVVAIRGSHEALGLDERAIARRVYLVAEDLVSRVARHVDVVPLHVHGAGAERDDLVVLVEAVAQVVQEVRVRSAGIEGLASVEDRQAAAEGAHEQAIAKILDGTDPLDGVVLRVLVQGANRRSLALHDAHEGGVVGRRVDRIPPGGHGLDRHVAGHADVELVQEKGAITEHPLPGVTERLVVRPEGTDVGVAHRGQSIHADVRNLQLAVCDQLTGHPKDLGQLRQESRVIRHRAMRQPGVVAQELGHHGGGQIHVEGVRPFARNQEAHQPAILGKQNRHDDRNPGRGLAKGIAALLVGHGEEGLAVAARVESLVRGGQVDQGAGDGAFGIGLQAITRAVVADQRRRTAHGARETGRVV